MSAARHPEVSAWSCGARAWNLFCAAPAPHLLGGFLLLAISGSIPVLGTLIAGPLWVGMCAASIKALRGETPEVQDLFAPLGDKRLPASLLYGLFITVLTTVTTMISLAWMAAIAGTMFGGGLTEDKVTAFTIQMTLAVLVALLPLVYIAYYVFPAGFYIAAGETDIRAALGKGMRTVWARRGFWSALWGVMMLGHLVGMLTCCIGLVAVMPWNCIAMGAGLAAQDPSLLADAVPPLPPPPSFTR